MSDPYYTDAVTLAAELRQRERSPVTVVEAFIERIKERNDRTNAFVTVAEEHARDRAREIETALDRGEDVGPLAGLPVAVKDLTRTCGIRTTFGSAAFADNVPDENDRVVDRIVEAGGIVIGKTNTPAFGRKTVTDNPVFGATRNPWDTTRTPGGSSGGSAAALADGLVPLALGSDAAGSIRVPSAFCGTFGLMPDVGRVPHGPSQADAFRNTQPFTAVGPMARTPRDAALLLDVLAGPDPCDPYSLPEQQMSYREALESPIDHIDLAYAPDFGGFSVDPAVQTTIEETLADLESAGASVTTIDTTFEGLWDELHVALEQILQTRYVGLYQNLKQDTGVDLLNTDVEITPEVVSRIKAGLELSVRDYKRSQRVRTRAYETVQDMLKGVDALLTPTTARPAFKLDEDTPTVHGHEVDPMHGWMLTWPLNLTGNPTASVPAGFIDGLPVGMQVIGARHTDDKVLAICDIIAQASSWQDAYPPSRKQA